MKRWRRWLVGIVLGGLLALGIALAIPDSRRWLAVTVIRADLALAANQYCNHLPPVDEVQIFHTGKWLKPNERTGHDTIKGLILENSRPLTGPEITSFVGLWRKLTIETDPMQSSLCHYPVYAIRFSHQHQVLLETTFCWKCQNFTTPSLLHPTELNFIKNQDATNLWNQITSLLPLPAAAEPKP